jgi:hypothetical protein
MTRGALVSIIYSKLLRSTSDDVDRSTAFSLVSNDAERIVDVLWRLLEPWPGLIQISLCTYLLNRQLGAVSCVPILVILGMWDLNHDLRFHFYINTE